MSVYQSFFNTLKKTYILPHIKTIINPISTKNILTNEYYDIIDKIKEYNNSQIMDDRLYSNIPHHLQIVTTSKKDIIHGILMNQNTNYEFIRQYEKKSIQEVQIKNNGLYDYAKKQKISLFINDPSNIHNLYENDKDNIYLYKTYPRMIDSSKCMPILFNIISQLHYSIQLKIPTTFHLPVHYDKHNIIYNLIQSINSMYYLMNKTVKCSIYYDWTLEELHNEPGKIGKINILKRYWNSFEQYPQIYYGIHSHISIEEYAKLNMNFRNNIESVIDFIIFPIIKDVSQ
jgi:hypothetical protein